MGQFGSKGGLRRIVPVKSDRIPSKVVLLRPKIRPQTTSEDRPASSKKPA